MHPELEAALADPQRREAAEAAIVWWNTGIALPPLQGRPHPEVAARLVMGASPRDLAPALTRKEAIAWSNQGEYEVPEDWLWSDIRRRYGFTSMVKSLSVEVLRWVDRCLGEARRRDALLRLRDVGIVMGDLAGGRLVDRLDELAPQDLVPDSVRATFARAVQRAMEERWSGPDRLIKTPKWVAKLPPQCALLTTFSGLFVEGAQMRHCLASYAEDVHEGRVLAFSIQTEDARSTLLVEEGQLSQHVGYANSDPPPQHAQLARKIMSVMCSSESW